MNKQKFRELQTEALDIHMRTDLFHKNANVTKITETLLISEKLDMIVSAIDGLTDAINRANGIEE